MLALLLGSWKLGIRDEWGALMGYLKCDNVMALLCRDCQWSLE